MNKRIVFKYNPFVYQQTVYYVDEENDYEEPHMISQDAIESTIETLLSSYDVKEVDLYGPIDYMEGFKKNLFTKFSDREDLKIELKGE